MFHFFKTKKSVILYLVKEKKVYVCTNCGYTSGKWFGRCPACKEWGTCKEYKEQQGKIRSEEAVISSLLLDVKPPLFYQTGEKAIDDLLGGGLAQGAVVLLGGPPGVGKSTLLLQMASKLSEKHNIIYVSAEESIGQLSLRAKRLNIYPQKIKVIPANDIDSIIDRLSRESPQIVIVDSIQAVKSQDSEGLVGSINQVKASAFKFVELAKKKNISTIITGHVTKEGVIAGPKVIEHMVDAVFYMEEEKEGDLRILRGEKNRFCKASKAVILEMTDNGLKIVDDPALLFYHPSRPVDGRALTIVMAGNQALLAEIQVLTKKTPFGMPRRTCAGFDINRLYIILAVLEKRMKLPVYMFDVFVNVAGGLKITDTTGDMALAAAIISSMEELPLNDNSVFLGELDLGGRIRKIQFLKKRIEEARRLGFKNIFSPSTKETNVIPVNNVNELFKIIKECRDVCAPA